MQTGRMANANGNPNIREYAKKGGRKPGSGNKKKSIRRIILEEFYKCHKSEDELRERIARFLNTKDFKNPEANFMKVAVLVDRFEEEARKEAQGQEPLPFDNYSSCTEAEIIAQAEDKVRKMARSEAIQ